MKTHKECLPAQGWSVLKKLGGIVSGHGFVLAGGTALALQQGHRISHDLDFFTLGNFRNDRLISEVRKVTRDFRVMSEEEGGLTAEIEGVKVSFLRYEYPFLDKTVRMGKVELAGVLDIAAMKVIAISQRGVRRDFVDLFTVLQDIPFHRVASHMMRRFGRERISPLHIGKSMVYFADAETDPDPSYCRGREISWVSVRKFFRDHTKQFVLDLAAARREIQR